MTATRCPICDREYEDPNATGRATNQSICDALARWEPLDSVGQVSAALAVARFRVPEKRAEYLRHPVRPKPPVAPIATHGRPSRYGAIAAGQVRIRVGWTGCKGGGNRASCRFRRRLRRRRGPLEQPAVP